MGKRLTGLFIFVTLTALGPLHAHADVDLRLLLGPEHGIRGAAQDMVGIPDARDPLTGLPEISLYGETCESLSPSPEHLSQIELLIFDVQDVGAQQTGLTKDEFKQKLVDAGK